MFSPSFPSYRFFQNILALLLLSTNWSARYLRSGDRAAVAGFSICNTRSVSFIRKSKISNVGINEKQNIVEANKHTPYILPLAMTESESDSKEEEFLISHEYKERAAQIAAMGGDPSFLSFDDGLDDDYFEDDTTEDEWEGGLSSTFMKELESSPDPLKSLTSRTANSEGMEDESSGGSMHFSADDDDDNEFDLETIGGDPSFLKMDKEDSDDGGWDGIVDEDAHYDLY